MNILSCVMASTSELREGALLPFRVLENLTGCFSASGTGDFEFAETRGMETFAVGGVIGDSDALVEESDELGEGLRVGVFGATFAESCGTNSPAFGDSEDDFKAHERKSQITRALL